METDTINKVQETTTPQPETAAQDPIRTFTQEEVNGIVQKRVAKYADYEDLKAKAAKYDEAVEASKSELQKATEKANALEAELAGLKKAEEVRNIRAEVAKEKGIPADLLTGETQEACEAQADALLSWAKPTGYPKVKDGGDPTHVTKQSTRDMFADWLNHTA